MILTRPLCALAIVLATFVAKAPASANEVGWVDLIDLTASTYEDPFRDLSYHHMRALRSVVAAREKLNAVTLASGDRHTVEAELANAKKTLEADGIDVDWLIAQRWVVADRRARAATAGNPDIDGQTITLAGFALAGPPAKDGAPVAYMVPERGMCSHVPPPNPNQMIRVRLNGDWRPAYAHEPVRLTGKVSITPTNEVFFVTDGPVQMRATFLMDLEKVETFPDVRAQTDTAGGQDWAQQMVERWRHASGARQSPPVASQ
jgi:hypothetical protein